MKTKKDVIANSYNRYNGDFCTERQIEALKKRVRQGIIRETAQKQELDELRSYVIGMSEKYAIETDLNHTERLYCEWKQRNVIVVGGHEVWQRKLREIFPTWKFVSNQKDVSEECLAGRKFIVCNTRILTHACYQKIQRLRNREQKVLYVHSSDPTGCIEELEQQLCMPALPYRQ